MKKIGIDLDGVITSIGLINPSVKLPRWLYVFLLPVVLMVQPHQKEEIKRISLSNEIIIVSARPRWIQNLTEKWLRFHKIPFDKIYCVGFGKGTKQRKLQIIEKEGIELFIDNDKRMIKFLNGNDRIKTKAMADIKKVNGPI